MTAAAANRARTVEGSRALSLLADELRRLGLEHGLSAVGIAGAAPFVKTRRDLLSRKAAGIHGGMYFTYGNPRRSTDPDRSLPGARSIVVAALSYLRRSASQTLPPGRPIAKVARYSWQDHYSVLREALGALAALLERNGWRTRVLADDNALVDRAAAYRAGIGWFGKNSMILLPGKGSWFVLGSVLTDAPLPVSKEPVRDGCGTCTRCISACPTAAIIAPGIVDARRCLAWRLEAPGPFPLEMREALGDRLYGCDECQEVCPPNRTAERRVPPPVVGERNEPLVDVIEMLSCSDHELMARFGRWYIARRQARYLRRNALVVLGNIGDGSDPEVEGVLITALSDPDGLVRSHAEWAASKLGRSDLVETPALKVPAVRAL